MQPTGAHTPDRKTLGHGGPGENSPARTLSGWIRFSSARERQLWALTALWLLLIYSSIYFVQFALDYLRDRNLLRLFLNGVFGLTAATVLLWLSRQRAGWRERTVFALSAVVYFLLLTRTAIVQEQIHYLEYGILGGLLYAALQERGTGGRDVGEWVGAVRRPFLWRPAIAAALLTGICGWVDEEIQGVLPNRVYDRRDICLNAAAGALVIAVIVLREWARGIDLRAGGKL